MNIWTKNFVGAMAAAATMALAPVAHANLIANGGFEASSDSTITPTGWTNIGHSDGIITYSEFGTPVYEGLNYYDLGGFGNASGPVGDGISQTVATTAGTLYSLVFGLSSENQSGDTTLRVSIGGVFTDFPLTISGEGVFKKALTTQTINYLATGSSTTISFIETLNTSGGANDPMIDGVIFDVAAAGPTGVPEPATLALLGSGLLGLGAMRRRRKAQK